MNLAKIITDEDFFKLWKHRIPTSYEICGTEAQKKTILFKETIDTLELIEAFVQDVYEGVEDESVLQYEFGVKNNHKKIKDICQRFHKIRLCKELFRSSDILISPYFKILHARYQFLETQQKLELQSKYSGGELKLWLKKHESNTFLYGGYLKNAPWTAESFPLQNAVSLVGRLREKIAQNLDLIVSSNKNFEQGFNNSAQYFDELLDKHSSVYVLALDINLISFLKQKYPESGESDEDGWLRKIGHIKSKICQLEKLLFAWTKIETNVKEELNLHCILAFRSDRELSEKDIIKQLREYIKIVVGDEQRIVIRNWSEVIRRNYSKSAVGLIKRSQTAKISEFKYWLLGYFLKVDFHLRVKLHPYLAKNLEINEFIQKNLPCISDINVANQKKKVKKNKPYFSKKHEQLMESPFLSQADLKAVFGKQPLPKEVLEYIKLVSHYFLVTELELGSERFATSIVNFIETLLYSKCMAFELSLQVEDPWMFKPQLKKEVTRLGLQFIALTAYENCGRLLLQQDYSPLIGLIYRPLIELNSIGLSKRACSELREAFPSKQIIIDINAHLASLRTAFNTPLDELGNRSIAEYRTYKYKQYKRRLESVTLLVQPLMKQDCLIYRVKFQLCSEGQLIDQAQFSKLLTRFFHFAERAKPLYWKLGYFGLWRENLAGQAYADVIILLDERAFHNAESIVEKINEQWVTFVSKNNEFVEGLTFMGQAVKTEVVASSIMLKNREYALERIFIEFTNKGRKADFLNEIIPEFLSTDIFEANPKQAFAKALIKSSKGIPRRKKTQDKKQIEQIDRSDKETESL